MRRSGAPRGRPGGDPHRTRRPRRGGTSTRAWIAANGAPTATDLEPSEPHRLSFGGGGAEAERDGRALVDGAMRAAARLRLAANMVFP